GEDPGRALQPAPAAARIPQAPAGAGDACAGDAGPAARVAGAAGRRPPRAGDALGRTGRTRPRGARGAASAGRRGARGWRAGRLRRPLRPAVNVLFADDWLAVVDKPAGLMVHDSALARGETDFAADRLREHFGKPIFLEIGRASCRERREDGS